MTSIGGFSSGAKYQKGHDIGISSADEGEGFIFVLDHGRHELAAVDRKTGQLRSPPRIWPGILIMCVMWGLIMRYGSPNRIINRLRSLSFQAGT